MKIKDALEMDNLIVLQTIRDNLFRITTNLTSEMYITDNIFQYIPQVENIVLVTPFYVDCKKIAKKIFNETKITGCINFNPSTATTFSIETQNLFYINISKCESSNNLTAFVEIIQRMKLNQTFCKKFNGEDLDEIINDIFALLNSMDDKKILASNIFVDCDDKNLKLIIEEKILNKFCLSDNSSDSQIKYAKFLKVPSHIKTAYFSNNSINDNPVHMGALIGGKIIYEGSEFMTKIDFLNNNYKKLSLYDLF